MFSMLFCSKWHYYKAISHSIRVLKDCSVYHCDCRVCLEMQFSQWIAINLFRSDIVLILPFPSTALPKECIAQAVLVTMDQFRTDTLCVGQGCYIDWDDHTAFCPALCNIPHSAPFPSTPPICRQFCLMARQHMISDYSISSCHFGHYILSHISSFETLFYGL